MGWRTGRGSPSERVVVAGVLVVGFEEGQEQEERRFPVPIAVNEVDRGGASASAR